MLPPDVVLRLKCSKFDFRWGSLQHSPRPSSCLRRRTSKETEGKGEGKRKGGKGEGREGTEGRVAPAFKDYGSASGTSYHTDVCRTLFDFKCEN